MRTRTLPGTDLHLSVVGMGCWAIGGQFWGDDGHDERSVATVRAALDHGINWFDTAPIYGWGHSEEVLTEALGPDRNDVIIASKVGVERVKGHARSNLNPENRESIWNKAFGDSTETTLTCFKCIGPAS